LDSGGAVGGDWESARWVYAQAADKISETSRKKRKNPPHVPKNTGGFQMPKPLVEWPHHPGFCISTLREGFSFPAKGRNHGLGWGNVNTPMHAAIKDAIVRGVSVVITSRVPNGRVLPNYGWAAAIGSGDLSRPGSKNST